MNRQQLTPQSRLVREAAQTAGQEWARKAEIANLPGLKDMREASIVTAADKAWKEYSSVFVDARLRRSWQPIFYKEFGRAARGES